MPAPALLLHGRFAWAETQSSTPKTPGRKSASTLARWLAGSPDQPHSEYPARVRPRPISGSIPDAPDWGGRCHLSRLGGSRANALWRTRETPRWTCRQFPARPCWISPAPTPRAYSLTPRPLPANPPARSVARHHAGPWLPHPGSTPRPSRSRLLPVLSCSALHRVTPANTAFADFCEVTPRIAARGAACVVRGCCLLRSSAGDNTPRRLGLGTPAGPSGSIHDRLTPPSLTDLPE